jgi:hypothetical protein
MEIDAAKKFIDETIKIGNESRERLMKRMKDDGVFRTLYGSYGFLLDIYEGELCQALKETSGDNWEDFDESVKVAYVCYIKKLRRNAYRTSSSCVVTNALVEIERSAVCNFVSFLDRVMKSENDREE